MDKVLSEARIYSSGGTGLFSGASAVKSSHYYFIAGDEEKAIGQLKNAAEWRKIHPTISWVMSWLSKKEIVDRHSVPSERRFLQKKILSHADERDWLKTVEKYKSKMPAILQTVLKHASISQIIQKATDNLVTEDEDGKTKNRFELAKVAAYSKYAEWLESRKIDPPVELKETKYAQFFNAERQIFNAKPISDEMVYRIASGWEDSAVMYLMAMRLTDTMEKPLKEAVKEFANPETARDFINIIRPYVDNEKDASRLAAYFFFGDKGNGLFTLAHGAFLKKMSTP